jgi:hypothetical protein
MRQGKRKEREKGRRGKKKEGRKKEKGKKGKERRKEKRKRNGREKKRKEEEEGERGGGRVGADRGGDRGRSATRVRPPRAVRDEKNRAGADCGKAVARGCRPPSGAGWDSGQVRCRSERIRARVLTTNGF